MSASGKVDGEAADDQWMPASAARRLVAERNGHYGIAIAIAARAHVGLLRAKADLFRHEVKAEYGRKQWKEFRDSEIPAEFWWAEGHAALEQNWEAGDFSTWIDKTYQAQAFGVKFDRHGIEAMLAPEAPDERPASELVEGSDDHTPITRVAGKGRNLSHNHPFAAAMTALKLADFPAAERRRFTAESVGEEMSEFYRDSHDAGLVPHADNLKDYGKGVLDALKRHWKM